MTLLKRANPDGLVSHFNLWLLTSTPPSDFKSGVSTLIPKSADSKTPGEYRPITICTMVARVYHRMIASRLERELPLSPRQKAFRRDDGLDDNVWLLRSIYRNRLKRTKPLCLCFIGVAKAFDSVSQYSFMIAARRLGAPESLIGYFSRLFHGSITALKLSKELSPRIHIGRGVRQCDRISAILFNCVMDWILSELDTNLGVEIKEGVRVNHLAFADDVALLAESRTGLVALAKQYENSLSMAGLKPNPAKSATIEIRVDGKRKKVVTGIESIVKLENRDVVELASSAAYQYLGIDMAANRTVLKASVKLSKGLENLTKAPAETTAENFRVKSPFIASVIP